MRWWLIRHPDHSFSRPIDEEALIARIEAGELAQKDEICLSGGYWFSIQDAMEVRKFLGDIRIQRNIPNDSETSTTIQGNVKTALTPGPEVKTGPQRMDYNGSYAMTQRAAPKPAPEPVATPFLEDEDRPSLLVRSAFFFVVALIFFGTIYLFWVQSKRKPPVVPEKKYQKSKESPTGARRGVL
jgi:hypothetical protein